MKITQKVEPTDGTEGVQSLAELAAIGDKIDHPDPTASELKAVEKEAEKSAQIAEKDVVDMLKIVRDMAAPLVESTGHLKDGQTTEIWNDDRLGGIAAPALSICERHGWVVSDVIGKYAPYIALGMALAVPAAETYKAVKTNQLPAPADGQQ